LHAGGEGERAALSSGGVQQQLGKQRHELPLLLVCERNQARLCEPKPAAVARLEAAGYVNLGKTNLHEFAYGISSYTALRRGS
jgi:hypothetical protein